MKQSAKVQGPGKKPKEGKRDFDVNLSEMAAKPTPPPLPRSASLWKPRQSLLPAGEVLITDVTAQDVTITVRECCTSRGFFREPRPSMEVATPTGSDTPSAMETSSSATATITSSAKDVVKEVDVKDSSMDVDGKDDNKVPLQTDSTSETLSKQ